MDNNEKYFLTTKAVHQLYINLWVDEWRMLNKWKGKKQVERNNILVQWLGDPFIDCPTQLTDMVAQTWLMGIAEPQKN